MLRGMFVPSGEHMIEFRFDPQVVKTGSGISLASSILLGLLVLGGLFYEMKYRKTSELSQSDEKR